MSTLVRTHYLDWEREEAGVPIVRMYRSASASDSASQAWADGLYVAGPWEDEVPRTSDHLAICEHLFAKYNADSRPDGRVRRSMSVGDIVQVGDSYYVCHSVGFKPITL